MKRRGPILAALLAIVVVSGCTLTAQKAPAGSQPDSIDSAQPKQEAPAQAGGAGGSRNEQGATQPAPSAQSPAGQQTAPANGGKVVAPADMEAKLVAPANIKRSQPATFSLEIKNNVAAMTITYRSGQFYDFWVEQNGKEVWRWSHGRMFTQALVTRTINAGDVLKFSVQWDGKGNDGKPLAPGSYTVHARWLAQTELATTPQPAPIQLTLE